MITRSLKRMEDHVDLYVCHPSMMVHGSKYSDDDDPEASKRKGYTREPLYGFTSLKQLYLKADPNYVGRYTVPILWDKKAHTMVNNESSEIIRMFYTEFDSFLPEADRETSHPLGGYYPEQLRGEIDKINDRVYNSVNNGVYKSGFAFTQAAYEANVGDLFKELDAIEKFLGDPAHQQPFLFGQGITDADIRLFPTIVRFDTAYEPIIMCNLGMIRENYPNLHLWMRRLYWDQTEKTRGAFFNLTQPYIQWYREEYAVARVRVLGITGPVIVPKGPLTHILPLGDEGKL